MNKHVRKELFTWIRSILEHDHWEEGQKICNHWRQIKVPEKKIKKKQRQMNMLSSYHSNPERIANAVQVTLWLLVSNPNVIQGVFFTGSILRLVQPRKLFSAEFIHESGKNLLFKVVPKIDNVSCLNHKKGFSIYFLWNKLACYKISRFQCVGLNQSIFFIGWDQFHTLGVKTTLYYRFSDPKSGNLVHFSRYQNSRL